MQVVFASWRDLAHPQAGGSEVLVDRLAQGLQARGHEVALMCGGPVAERPYPVIDLGGTYSQYVHAAGRGRQFNDWDLLVDVENGIPFFSPLWRRGPILCLVHHVHTDQWTDRFSPPVAAIGRGVESTVMPRLYKQVPFVAVSPSTAAALVEIGVPPDHLRWAPLNAVEPPPVAAAKADEPLFVVVGRLVPHKRVDLALRIWDEVRRRTGGHLVVAGDGPERSRLEAMAGPAVTFVGRVDEDTKWELLAQARLLVTAAHHEGWGVTIIEAGAVGTPALGFDVPGVRDAVIDGVSGVLAASTGEFAQRWVSLGLDEAESQTLGDGAHQVAVGFTWDASVSHFEQIAAAAATGRPLPGEPGGSPGGASPLGRVSDRIENNAHGR